MLLTVTQRGFVHLGMPLYREPVSRGWVGWEETALASAASQWPLVRCIYNRAQWRGRADNRSLTARKHAVKGRKGTLQMGPSRAFTPLAPFSRTLPSDHHGPCRPPHLSPAPHGARQGCCPQWMVHLTQTPAVRSPQTLY